MSGSEVYALDVLDVRCPECGAPPGRRCGPTLVAGPNPRGYYSRARSHKARILALAAATELNEPPPAEDLSPEGHLRVYTYGDFEDDDLWDDEGASSCASCGGNGERGYDDCEYASLDCYVPGPDQVDDDGQLVKHGCPRVVGAF